MSQHVTSVVITVSWKQIPSQTWSTNWHPNPTLKARIEAWNQSIFAAQPMPRCDKFQSLIRPGLTLKHESCRKNRSCLSAWLAPSQLSWLNATLKSCQLLSIHYLHPNKKCTHSCPISMAEWTLRRPDCLYQKAGSLWGKSNPSRAMLAITRKRENRSSSRPFGACSTCSPNLRTKRILRECFVGFHGVP